MSGSYNGIMSCLWDNSNKKEGDMNYYDRIIINFIRQKLVKILKKYQEENLLNQLIIISFQILILHIQLILMEIWN